MSDKENSNESDYDPEAEVEGNWQAVQLPEVPVVTGEEQDEELSKFRAKLYRWREAQWKERGVGEMRLLKNKQNGKIRILMRQEKTLKIVANFYVLQQQGLLCVLTPQKTSDKAWIWDCCDASDHKPQIDKLCAKFTSIEGLFPFNLDFKKFKEEFEKALEHNTNHVK